MKIICLLFGLLLNFSCFNVCTADNPPPVGNFALPPTQQPGPFFSFEQNIIDAGQMQFYVTPSHVEEKPKHFETLTFSFIYGLTDEASLYFEAPTITDFNRRFVDDTCTSSTNIQLEYAYVRSSNHTSETQATIVGAAYLPTQINLSAVGAGCNAPAYFLGTTFNQTYVNWLWFASPGVVIPTNLKDTARNGTIYYYQAGIGPTIFGKTNRYILAALLELDGIYKNPTRLFGNDVINTGGNAVYLTPSIWFTTQRALVQVGASWPIVQSLSGIQRPVRYLVAANFAWTFNP